MNEAFFITTDNFNLLEAFMKEALELGWVYNGTPSQLLLNSKGNNKNFKMTPRSNRFYNTSCVPSDAYELPQDWKEAVKALKIKKDVEVSIQEIANWKGVPAELIKIKQ